VDNRDTFKEIPVFILGFMTYRENASSTSEKILHAIIESLKAFRGSVKQEDDVTLAVVKIVQ